MTILTERNNSQLQIYLSAILKDLLLIQLALHTNRIYITIFFAYFNIPLG